MFHIFFLVLVLASGKPFVGMSDETYPTLEACKAAVAARVEEGNKVFTEHGGALRIVTAACSTEEDAQKALKSKQDDSI